MIDKSINYYKKKLIIIIIIFFVNKLLFKVLFYKNIKIFEYLQFLLESKKIEYFLKSINALKIKPINYNNINYLPKISIISPIYNSEKYLLRFLNCLQNQNFHKIEIIIIDDNSIDNSIKIIEKYRVNDKRIVLLKNKYNKGTFITRNLGIIYSKGKFIISPDPDDILSKNIIVSCFKYAEKYNYEMIRFNIYIGKKKLLMKNYVNKLVKKEVYQPELSTYNFYGIDELMMIDFSICNKFVKKEVYIRALNIIQKYIYRLYTTYYEDRIVNFFIYKTSNTYFFLNKIGYYYITKSLSITNNLFKKSKFKLQFFFILINIIFNNSKNTKYGIDMTNWLLASLFKQFNALRIFRLYKNIFPHKIMNIFLNCKFITKDNKDALALLNKI